MEILLRTAFIAALVCLHLWWRARHRRIREELEDARQEIARLRQARDEIASQFAAHRQTLFNNMVEGVLWLDRHRHIQLMNEALAKLLHVTENVEGRRLVEVVRLPQLLELLDKTEQEGQVPDYDMKLPGLDDRFLQVNAATIRDAHDTVQGFILVFHDLTRLKQLEKTRQEFIANVSHELRTPLSVIKGYIETLLDGALDDPNTAKRFLQIIQRHTARLTLLIEDLLTLSRLESGQIKMELVSTPLRDLVDHVIDELSARAQEEQVTLVNELPEQLELPIDSNRMYQVFLNLLDNGIKYGSQPGQVRVGCLKSEDDPVTLYVADTGPGIPPEAQNRIFERFYRSDSARSRERGGTGLGLAIVKHIVQSHEGRVWIQSSPGSGACFYLSLPHEASSPQADL